MLDFSARDEGTIWLLTPLTPAAHDFVDVNLPVDHMTWGPAVVVEHCYIRDIIEGIQAAGLNVGRG